MVQLLKKLKHETHKTLHTKLGPEAVHKAPHQYSHQNLFLIICRLSAPAKAFFTIWILR